MITKYAGYSIVATFTILVLLLITMALTPATSVPTSRFEVLFPATTADEVVVTVRLLGSYHTEIWNGQGEFLQPFKAIVRDEFVKVDHADIPKKVKLMFQPTLSELEDAGVKIDSIYQYVPEI